MASIRIFMFSYDSLLCTEWPTGIECRVLPLWRRTALRINIDESIKSRQSRGLWLILRVCIRPSISVQASSHLSISKNSNKSSCLLRYTEILTFSFRRFHCCSLETYISALLVGKSRSLIISFNSSCVIRWISLNWRSAVKSASVDVEGWDVFSRFSVGSSSESKIYCCGGNETGRSLVWDTGRIADGILGQLTVLCFLCNSVPKWRNYTKIAVCEMVGWFPPCHGKGKRHWTPFVI